MKKIFPLIICITLISGVSFASSDIKVYLDNSEIALSGKAVMENGRVLVPMRSIFESIGASVNWDAANNLITSEKDANKIALQIGNKNMGLNGKLIALDVAPKIESGRTLVPVRVVSESFGYKVDWDGENKCVYIDSGAEKNIDFFASQLQNNTDIQIAEAFDWVLPKLVISYYEGTANNRVLKNTIWNEPINREVTINSNKVEFVQCTDEIDFRNQMFNSYVWPMRLSTGTKVTLIKMGKIYSDTLYVRLSDGRQGVIYESI